MSGKFATVTWEPSHIIEQCEVKLTEKEATDFLQQKGGRIRDHMVSCGVEKVDDLLPAYLKSIGKGS